MRYLLTLILCVQLLFNTYAQTSRISDITFVAPQNASSKIDEGGSPDKKLKANAAQARKKIVGLFNLFKDYEIIVDTAAMRSAFTDLMKDEPSTSSSTAQVSNEMSAAEFSSYLDKTH